MDLIEKIKKEGEIKRHKKNARIILFIGVLLIIIAPYVLTKYSVFKWADFSKTGEIGDTIGGLTSPIVNLISAVLIYLSFQQQLLANEIQISMLNSEKEKDNNRVEKEALLFHYNEIKDSIKSISYRSSGYAINNNFNYNGVEAISVFLKDLRDNPRYSESSMYHLLDLLLIDVETFVATVNTSQYLDPAEKEYYKFRIHNLYFQQLLIPLDDIEEVEKKLTKTNLSVRIKIINKELSVPQNT